MLGGNVAADLLAAVAPGLGMIAAVVVDQIGRVGGHQAGALASHGELHLGGIGGIAAEQTMVAQEDEVARLGDRLLGDLGHLVGIGEALGADVAELGELIWVETKHTQVVAEVGELGDLQGQQIKIPGALFGGAVVSQAVGLDLLRGKVAGDMDRHLRQAKALGGQKAGVACDDHALGINYDGLTPAVLGQRGRHLSNGRFGGDARVTGVGDWSLDRPPLDRQCAVRPVAHRP